MQSAESYKTPISNQGPYRDLALHTIGWKAFQDLCAHVIEDVVKLPVEIYREAHDDGQDAVFLSKTEDRPVTVQCKFSSVVARSLKPSDIKLEEQHVIQLTRDGLADRYVLMTNMSVQAATATAIRARLKELGVKRAHIFGKEYLTRVIRSSSKLRALVPLVYGLGDLSLILDERRAKQAKAVLGHLQPTLRSYVTTAPHVRAVRALAKHKIVLLIGDAATGKSTIAAVLATVAADNPRHRCFKADGPIELMESWNPDEGGALYWVDDAFGPNQLRQDFIDAWITMMPKVQAALAGGNSFVLTSRRHIYEAAKPKLGSRNHPLFRNGEALVEVGNLSPEERRQILYNHIKAGNQPTALKSSLREHHLDALAQEEMLIPEIARQLGDIAYTQRVSLNRESLTKFIRSNRQFLHDTIKELSKEARAALTLVFLHGGKMQAGNPSPHMQELVKRHYDIDRETLGDALGHLKGSFLVEKIDSGQTYWTFKHPTLADALASTLGEVEGMRELYLRGVSAETILSSTACASEVGRDYVLIPETLETLLVDRLLETPDEAGLNRQLFSYLADKASEAVVRALIARAPHTMSRTAVGSWRSTYDPKVRAFARALSLNLLSGEHKEEMSYSLESDLFRDLDTSFLDDDKILALLSVPNLIGLISRIKSELIPKFEEKIESCEEEADLDLEPRENFEDVEASVSELISFLEDRDTEAFVSATALAAQIESATLRIAEKKEEQQRERQREEWEWEELSERVRATGAQQVASRTAPETPNPDPNPRSIFSDVDQ